MEVDYKGLIAKAFEARKHAYAPYSQFYVGAALLCKDGSIYQGCNIENAAFTPGNCGERTAIFKAVYDGHKDFRAIAIVAGKDDDHIEFGGPCGVCRQVMMEFCNPNTFEIIMAKSEDEYIVKTLGELFPFGFGPENLA